MDWLRSVNDAISYMEEHLLGSLAPEEVAAQVYLSCGHFQRAFSVLTGMTVGEYIRARRLNLAGQELAARGARVLDVALKYGYETPESFSKAFLRFHGVTMSQVKLYGAGLKSFHRLTVKIKLEAGTRGVYFAHRSRRHLGRVPLRGRYAQRHPEDVGGHLQRVGAPGGL